MQHSLFSSLPKPIVFAHRGASEEFPENTMLAFEQAVQQGAAGIETDLQVTRDDQIVCIHDGSLDHLTTMQGKISETTRVELSKARVKHSVYGDQKIPTLAEVLEWLPEQTLMILELKDRRFREHRAVAVVIELLEKHNAARKTVFASFSMANLIQAKKAAPSIPTCWITPWNPSTRKPTDIIAPFFPILWVNRSYVKNAHKTGRMVSVWDPHPEKRIARYLKEGVDMLTGDNPRRLLEAIRG